jgi:predicted small lipoprotein YifL
LSGSERTKGAAIGRRGLLLGLLLSPALPALLVAGCGKRGPLSLPGEAADAAEEEMRARQEFER